MGGDVQVYRKAVKQGFDFTLMVVGASGLGKSTFINSLFLSQIYNQKDPKHHLVSHPFLPSPFPEGDEPPSRCPRRRRSRSSGW